MTAIITIVLAFIVTGVMFALMSIGVIAGRDPIKGSCGGLNSRGCELCSGKCRGRSESEEQE